MTDRKMYTIPTEAAEPVVLDYRGRTALVRARFVVEHPEQVKKELRAFIEKSGNKFQLTGFTLGKIIDVSVHGPYWIDFSWMESPIQVQPADILRILLDDEGEPDMINGYPRIV